MKAKILPKLALLSLVCVACTQTPLAQQPPASSAPNTPTPTPPISPPTQTPLAQQPAAPSAPNTPPISPPTQTAIAQKTRTSPTPKTQSPQPSPTQTSLQVAQKSTNSLPLPQTYDLRVINEQLWRRLTKITFGEDSIIVTMAITNGSKEVVVLNAKDGMYLEDNAYHSHRYNLLPPSNNTQIMIKPGTTLKGQFVFVGWLAPEATKLSLYYSDRSGNSTNLFYSVPIKR